MVLVYVTLITMGDITFSQVPAKQQKAVKDKLFTMGLDENGNPLPTETVTA